MGLNEVEWVGKSIPGVPYPVCRAEEAQRLEAERKETERREAERRERERIESEERQRLEMDKLGAEDAKYFAVELCEMFTSRETELLQNFVKKNGKMPKLNGMDDDLY